MPRRSTRAKVTMAVLAFPLLLGCNCCDLLALPEDKRPAFTAERVVGVWSSACGGKVSLAEGGSFRAQDLMADAWAGGSRTTAAVTGTGTWETHGQDANEEPTVRLLVEGARTVALFAVNTDKFSDLEMEVHKPTGTTWCRLTR